MGAISGLRATPLNVAGAISNASRGKDYWDIHELLNHFSPNEMLNLAAERFPHTIDKNEIITKLASIPNEIDDPSIISLKGDYWEFVIEDIQEEALKPLNDQMT